MAKADGNWYIARIAPGFSREAPKRVDRNGELRQPEREGESKVERSLRDEGFDCYYPRMRKELIHHRTKEKIVRAFPLFTGYIFVNAIAIGAKSAKDCDGVTTIMGENLDGKPWPVPARVVERFRVQELNLEFDDTTAARIRRREEGRTARETLEMKFPEGQEIRVKKDWKHDHMLGGFHGHVVSVTGRGTMKIMMQMFGSLVPVEIDVEEVEPVVDEQDEAA